MPPPFRVVADPHGVAHRILPAFAKPDGRHPSRPHRTAIVERPDGRSAAPHTRRTFGSDTFTGVKVTGPIPQIAITAGSVPSARTPS